ncbi:MAG: hypothetical protein ACHQD7_04095 [Chitinophagales bacterium]
MGESAPVEKKLFNGLPKLPLSDSIITTKLTENHTLLNSGYGDELKYSAYTGVVAGDEGSAITTDASASYGKPEGASVTFGDVRGLKIKESVNLASLHLNFAGIFYYG